MLSLIEVEFSSIGLDVFDLMVERSFTTSKECLLKESAAAVELLASVCGAACYFVRSEMSSLTLARAVVGR